MVGSRVMTAHISIGKFHLNSPNSHIIGMYNDWVVIVVDFELPKHSVLLGQMVDAKHIVLTGANKARWQLINNDHQLKSQTYFCPMHL